MLFCGNRFARGAGACPTRKITTGLIKGSNLIMGKPHQKRGLFLDRGVFWVDTFVAWQYLTIHPGKLSRKRFTNSISSQLLE